MVKSRTFCMKKKKQKQKNEKNKKQRYSRIHSIKFLHSSKTPSLAESKFCKKSPSVFSYYLPNETIHALVMNEACVAVLFAYKWLHNFVKALDEILKKYKLV